MTETVTVDPELAKQALGDVLDADAAKAMAAAPPPRRPPPPDATPEAPWGFKADGTARKGPAGPGRPKKDAAMASRTEKDEAGTPGGGPGNSQVAVPRSYAQEVSDALTIGWMILATVPMTKAPAAVLHEGIPAMVPAWDKAAQANPAIRSVVLKLSGEGSWAWMIPVAITTVPVVMGMWQAAVDQDKELRARLVAKTDADLKEFVIGQARAAGMEIPDDEPQPPAAETPLAA